MNTATQIGLTAVIVALVAGAGGYFAGASSAPEASEAQAGGHMMPDGSMMGGHMMPDGSTMGGSMSDMHGAMSAMMSGLEGKTGDEFDRAFLSGMIEHHEGAVAMARAVLKNSNREELKQMARDIIEAQTREINQMKQWETTWFSAVR